MKRWLAAVVTAVTLAACSNTVELAECFSIPPTTFSEEQCQGYGTEAKCSVTQRKTTVMPDGGISSSCHHENCATKPTCPSI